MRPASLYRLLGVVCLVLPGCKKSGEDVATHWLKAPVQIDGRFADWEAVPTSRTHQDRAVLKLASDSQALYLYYVTDDLDWVRTIKMTGLTVYLNLRGSRDRDFFITYRDGPPTSELLPDSADTSHGGKRVMHPALRHQLLESERAQRATFTCFVRDWIVEKSIPTDGRQGPAAAFGKHEGRFAYEFKVPLRQSEALIYGLPASPGTVVGIGAEWGGLPLPVLDSEPPPGASEFGGTRGRVSSADEFGYERSAPPPGTPPKLPEKQELWITSRLPTP